MHEIQKNILKVLTLSPRARYRDIKPKEMEGNLFMYHLNKLLSGGYVEKKGIYYELTSKGKVYAGRLSLSLLEPRIQPKIVTMIAARNKLGEFLLYKQKRQPFYDLVSLPYGKVHYGEEIEEAAKRELFEKTGLSGKLKLLGSIFLLIDQNLRSQDLVNSGSINHMMIVVFRADNLDGKLKNKLDDRSEVFWGDPKKIKTSELIPGTKEILELVQKAKTQFFAEIKKSL